MNKLRDLIANNAGVISTSKLTINEGTEFDFEKKKLEVKSRAISMITMLMNDVKSIKNMIDNINMYPSYGQKEEPMNEDQKKVLKKIAYKILRKHLENVEELIENELGWSGQTIVAFKQEVLAPEVDLSYPEEQEGEY